MDSGPGVPGGGLTGGSPPDNTWGHDPNKAQGGTQGHGGWNGTAWGGSFGIGGRAQCGLTFGPGGGSGSFDYFWDYFWGHFHTFPQAHHHQPPPPPPTTNHHSLPRTTRPTHTISHAFPSPALPCTRCGAHTRY